jgi:hypothetical protein
VLVVTLVDVKSQRAELTKTHIIVCPRATVVDRTFRIYQEAGKQATLLDLALVNSEHHLNSGESLRKMNTFFILTFFRCMR